MKKLSSIALVAGILFFMMALFVQGILPIIYPPIESTSVNSIVVDKYGNATIKKISARPYTAEESRGRQVYVREGCFYCHSQYVRPLDNEINSYGPVSQFDEYANDQPHLLGTRRIGPDLSRIGNKYSDEWHFAHLFDPRLLNKDSIMPSYPSLFKRNTTENGSAATEGQDAYAADDTADKTAASSQASGNPSGNIVPTADGKALVAYLQQLGTDAGDWREQKFSRPALAAPDPGSAVKGDRNSAADGGQTSASNDDQTSAIGGDPGHGKVLFERRCAGCHGIKGDGRGEAAGFLDPKPRDFTKGVFKFVSVDRPLPPKDTDLLRTITVGIPGTAMPSWENLSMDDRMDLVAYIKTLSNVFEDQNVDQSQDQTNAQQNGKTKDQTKDQTKGQGKYGTAAASTPAVQPESTQPRKLAAMKRGKMLFKSSGCTACHGERADGKGPLADALKDYWGQPVHPANLRVKAHKSGYRVEDIYRTINYGLVGTPMQSWKTSLSENERWDLAYFIYSLSKENGR